MPFGNPERGRMHRDKKTRGAAALLLLIPLGSSCSAGGSTGVSPTSGSAGGGTGGTPVYGSGGTSVVAGTGGTLAQGSGGSSGPAPHDPSLFSWPEANPDGSTATLCKAGHYVGTYTCNVIGPNGFGSDAGAKFPLTGPVDLRLADSQNGEFLSVSGGSLKSSAGFLQQDSTVAGTLNCQTGAFSGTLQNGTLSIPPFPPGGTFTGNLSAGFVSNGPKLDGSWTLIGLGQFTGYSCTGPWTATWQAS